MNLVIALPRAPWTAGLAGWRAHLGALGFLTVALLALFARDAAHMATIWWESSTYNHCLLIVPIIAWLVWQRREALAALRPAAWAPGLFLVAAGGLGWLLGEAGEVALARHAGVILMLQGAAIACLGPAVSRGLAFPLFYMLFLIPAGEEIVPAMQTLTAHMCMALLALAGIPAHLEGIFITTPAGYFEVAEACAGVMFLVAMVAYGALVANLCFRSWIRRALFMAAAIVIPILANGVRAFGTVYIAQHAGIDFAAGFDHILYGWIFFAIVIALVMAAGWPFFDRAADEPAVDPATIGGGPITASSLVLVVPGALLLAVSPLLWSTASAAPPAPARPAFLMPPVPAGWTPVAPADDWRPRFAGADAFGMVRLRDERGHEVDVALARFDAQGGGRQVVGHGQGAAPPEGTWAWIGDAPPPPGGRAERIGSHGVVREVASFYRIDRSVTGSGVEVKLEGMKARLLGRPARAEALLVSARAPAAGVSARPAIDAFLADLGPVAAALDDLGGE
jgi:exosortase A